MANEKKASLTPEQRAALKPLIDRLESAYDELSNAVAAAVPRDNPDGNFLFCLSCPRPGSEGLCSSFLGRSLDDGGTLGDLCQRDFCKHKRMLHF